MAMDALTQTAASARQGTRKSTRKRQAIIHAAINVINDKSYALATMSEIAAALDLRDGALYYYFKSKQALAYACHVHSLGVFDRILHSVDGTAADGFTKLREFIRGMLVDGERSGAQLYFGDYSYLDEDQRDHIGRWSDELIEILERFLREGTADGSVVQCEPEVVVQLVLGMLIWLAKWAPSMGPMSTDRLMSAIDSASLNSLSNR